MPDPHYKALLIGNGTFDRDPHKLFPLKGPANDLRVLREALVHSEYGLFEPANVRHLLDGMHGEILEAVEMFFTDAGPEDHLLFYYSGHGYPDTNNNLYLCARNTRTNLLGSSAIPDKTINLMAENSRARKFIFVLDCCHSGGFKGGTAGVQLAHGSGRCLITACASDQLSSDSLDASGASTFTHFLAEALTCGSVDTDGDGIVLTSEVFKYVQPRVYNATKQTVQWSMDKTFGEAAIARAMPRQNPAGRPAPEVKIQTEAGRPVLEVSWDKPIEFRQVQPGEKLPVERIDIFNTGDGALNWIFECEEPWIQVERKADSLFVRLDTSQPGLRRGNLYVRDKGRGGSRTIRVLLEVVEPLVPRMIVSPAVLDFGTRSVDATAKLELRVSNGGPGRLTWDVESAPSQVIISRHEQGLTLELAPNFVGTVKDPLRLKSNGGNAEVPITATVTPLEPPLISTPGPSRIDPLMQTLQGWWTNNAGAIRIQWENGGLTYTDHNLMGIKVGQGTIQVQNGIALVQGMNTFTGAYTGQVVVHGNMLNGSFVVMGQAMPVMFTRQEPWFAAFA